MDVRCPQCLKDFPWRSYRLTNAAGETLEVAPDAPSGFFGRIAGRMTGSGYSTPHDRGDVLKGGFELHCPDGHWVPGDLDEQRTHVIGLIGPPGSSKSHFIAAVVGQMLQGRLSAFNITVHLHRWCQQHVKTEYLDPLWGRGEQLPATPPMEIRSRVNPPVAIEVREVHSSRKWNIVFFDAAGEDLQDASRQARYSFYLAKAQAMIFLVEPSNIRNLERRPDGGRTGMWSGGVADELIHNTADMLRTIRGSDAGFTDLPTAVVVAKSDLLDGHPDLPPDLLGVAGDDGAVRPDTLGAIADRSDRIARFLEDQEAKNLFLTVQEAFPDHTFHLVSSTGCPPEPDAVEPRKANFPRVEPRRCLDPVASLLERLGVLVPERSTP